MKINRNKTKRRNLIIAASILAIAILGGTVAVATMGWPLSFTPKEQSSEPKSTNNSSSGTEDTPSAPSTEKDGKTHLDEPTKQAQAANIKILSLVQANGVVKVSAAVTGMASGGQCTAYLTSEVDSDIVSKSLTTSKSGNEINCEALIPENEFSYLGRWNARVVYSKADKITDVSGSLIIK